MAYVLPKKSQGQTVDEVVKIGLTQKYCFSRKRPQYRAEFNSKYSKGKWAFII